MSQFQTDCHAVGFPRNDHKVNMVRHQTITNQGNTMLFKILFQQGEGNMVPWVLLMAVADPLSPVLSPLDVVRVMPRTSIQ
jgi:hypothetical protein